MQEIVMGPATLLVLLAIVAGAVLAARRLARRGLCDCGDHCDRCDEGCHGCRGCSGGAPSCPAAESLAARAQQEASS